MEQNSVRPYFLNLIQIRLPIAGVLSILHRITGLILVLILPIALYLLDRSLGSPSGFEWCRGVLRAFPGMLMTTIVVGALALHFFAGVRHLLLDLDICVDRLCARRSAWLAMCATLLVMALYAFLI